MSQQMKDENGITIPGTFMPGKQQAQIATSVANAQSAAFLSTTTQISVRASVDTFVTLGANPVASTTPGVGNFKVYANKDTLLTVVPGQKLGAILGSGTGTLEIIEML